MLYRFADFELDTASLTMRYFGTPVDLPGKAVETLAFLLSRTGTVVTKDQFMEALWPDGFVEEANLAQYIYLLRRAFRDRGFPNLIQTYPRRGYSFDPPALVRRPRWRAIASLAASILLLFVGPEACPARQLDGEAMRAYSLGRYFWNLRSVDGMTRSVTYFRRVISLAPESALGYAALADAYTELADFEQPCRECEAWRRSADAAAARAIAIDPSSAEAHVAYGMAARVFRNDDRSAAREFETALALDPSSALANQWYGNMLIAQGSGAEGLRRLQLAASEQPVSTATYAWLARGYYYERRYADAEHYAREALALEPTRFETSVLLGLIEEARGRFKEALAQFERVSLLGASRADVQALRAGVYAGMGERALALRMLRPLLESSTLDVYASRDLVIALAAVGEVRAARARLAHISYGAPIDRELLMQDPTIRKLTGSPAAT